MSDHDDDLEDTEHGELRLEAHCGGGVCMVCHRSKILNVEAQAIL